MTRAAPAIMNWRLASALLVGAVVAVIAAANAHLVWVALKSQPECVPHSRAANPDDFRAARSAC